MSRNNDAIFVFRMSRNKDAIFVFSGYKIWYENRLSARNSPSHNPNASLLQDGWTCRYLVCLLKTFCFLSVRTSVRHNHLYMQFLLHLNGVTLKLACFLITYNMKIRILNFDRTIFEGGIDHFHLHWKVCTRKYGV